MREHMKRYIEFGKGYAVRGTRILAEFMLASETLEAYKKYHYVTVFGSARLSSNHPSYELNRRLGYELAKAGYGVVTGGAAGVMEAANRGAYEAAKEMNEDPAHYSIGCGITLPFEQSYNPYLGIAVDFHYFFIRKYFLVYRSKAFFLGEGGFGTRDEMWEIACLMQTGKMPLAPIVLVGDDEIWRGFREDMKVMVERHVIHPQDVNLIHTAHTPAEGVKIVQNFYRRLEGIYYDKHNNRIEFHLKENVTGAQLAEMNRHMPHGFPELAVADDKLLSMPRIKMASYAELYPVVEAVNG